MLSQRVERLACDFASPTITSPGRRSAAATRREPIRRCRPTSQEENFEILRDRADRVRYVQRSFTETLRDAPAASFDRYVLLDAQDWMNDADLTALWTEIARTARPGARVIFRTAADERLLPGRVPDDMLGRVALRGGAKPSFGPQDRSSIYGAFHLYVLKGA